MSRELTREELLELPIELYNRVMNEQWEIDKIVKNLSGDLNDCEYCKRKMVISCICNEGVAKWDRIIAEVGAVSQRDRSGEF